MHSGYYCDGRPLVEQVKQWIKEINESFANVEEIVEADCKTFVIGKEEDFTTTTIEVTNVKTYPYNNLQSLEKELKSIKKRLKRCGYIESQELREREIEVRKQIKHEKRRIGNVE